MEEEILKTLRSIGLTEGEAKVYYALLTLGTSSVGHIIKISDVSASKVYTILERLANKGLVSVVIESKTKLFTAAKAERLLQYLDDESSKIERNKENVRKMLPALLLKQGSAMKEPIVEVAKGARGFRNFFDEMIEKARQNDIYMAIAGLRITFRLQNFWYEYSRKKSDKGIRQYMIYEHDGWYKKDPNVHKRQQRKLYYPKVLGKKYSNIPNMIVLGDMALVNDIEDNEVFSLLIRNKNLANALKKIFMIVRDSGYVPEGFKEGPEIKV